MSVLHTIGCTDLSRHEHSGHDFLARRLAAHLGLSFAGELGAGRASTGVYLVPAATLSGAPARIAAETDLFGGWTPEPFMATKAVMHPLVADAGIVPPLWPDEMGKAAVPVTLAGYSAFSRRDALRAGSLLLDSAGDFRLKQVGADGGRGQEVIDSTASLEAALDRLPDEAVAEGLVLEENLRDVRTLSVGRVTVPGRTIAYVGTQSLTLNNRGSSTYGGSSLLVFEGGFERLAMEKLPVEEAAAVERAVAFDRLADLHLEGLVASRRNYDVAVGVSASGALRMGVLEQSWRIGGASGAEIAALEAFAADPSLKAVRASTVERYGRDHEAPAGAAVIFQGEDPVSGALLKYAIVEDRIAG